MKITMSQPDDETLEIKVGRKTIATFTHDCHGFSGMSDARLLVIAIAKAFRIEVVDNTL